MGKTEGPGTATEVTGTAPGAEADAERTPLAVVAVGASAGGLDAFERFLAAMPPSSGLAVVLIQHFDPSHTSYLAEILAHSSPLPVVDITDGVAVEPDHVYVLPSNAAVSIAAGRLHLERPIPRAESQTTIDRFFGSLALDQAERAVGVVLTGMGLEGANGVRAIKAAGGLTFAQDPKACAHDPMPLGAIATGDVDLVLPVEQIPAAIVRAVAAPRPPVGAIPREAGLEAVLTRLRTQLGADFGSYKKSMIARRVHRRMALRNVATLDQYARLVTTDRRECEALCRDLLIRVTSFFREPAAWEALREHAIEPLVAATPDRPLRAWTAGCATGEEAYTLAILLAEALERAGRAPSFQIFATDVDAEALAVARAARYPATIEAHMSAARLARFFVADGAHYVLSKELRELVLLAPQNLVGDPPFSKLDLVVCRNLLIYLEPHMQQRVLRLFHFALRDGGYLFLGGAETGDHDDDLFETLASRERVFRRRATTRREPPPGSSARAEAFFQSLVPSAGGDRSGPNRVALAAHKLLALRFAPAAVLVDRAGEVVHFSGPTDPYLAQPPGTPTRDLVSLSRDAIRAKVRGVLKRALQEDQSATTTCRVRGAHTPTAEVRISAEPLRAPSEVAGLILVTFEVTHRLTEPALSAPLADAADENAIHELEEELRLTRDDLRASLEQIESSNEELRAAHEEAISTNEELQSANEELETSKEELQSLNEELSTVNAQLEAKVAEVTVTRDDLENLLASTELATLILDRGLRIQRFTAAMTRLMRLIPTDCGRPVSDFGQEIAHHDLAVDAALVLRDLRPIEREVSTPTGEWFTRRVLPYRTGDDRIEGVVVTFTDVTIQKRATAEAQRARAFAESIVDTVSDGLLVVDAARTVLSANRSFREIFGTGTGPVAGRRLTELAGGWFDTPEVAHALDALAESVEPSARVALDRDLAPLGRRSQVVTARRIDGHDTAPGAVLLAIEDISERARLEAEERALRVAFDRQTRDSIAALEAGNECLEHEAGERRALEEELQRIVDSEQRRIGQDLHDEIGQDLTAINYLVHNLHDALADAGHAEAEAAGRVTHQVSRVQERLRAVTRALLPLKLESQGLREALADLTADLSTIYGVPCRLTAGAIPEPLEPMVATNLYRIAQEALTNAFKHARARAVEVHLESAGDRVVLEVLDDGSGIDRAVPSDTRLGMRIMRHRARLIGADLTFSDRPLGGTAVRCSVPHGSVPHAPPHPGGPS